MSEFEVTYIGTTQAFIQPHEREVFTVEAGSFEDAVVAYNKRVACLPGDAIMDSGEVERYLVREARSRDDIGSLSFGPDYLYTADESGAVSGPQEDQR